MLRRSLLYPPPTKLVAPAAVYCFTLSVRRDVRPSVDKSRPLCIFHNTIWIDIIFTRDMNQGLSRAEVSKKKSKFEFLPIFLLHDSCTSCPGLPRMSRDVRITLYAQDFFFHF